ncbi:MAG: TetR/AcrR family transcriptional regulator [Cyclobacteriaceae bacterium]
MNKKDVILQRSHALFQRYGVVRVTMDMIADTCGVSKKTIYQLFENKDNLLYQVLIDKAQEIGDEIINHSRAQANAYKSIQVFLMRLYDIFKNGDLQDIKRLHPDSYQLMMGLRENLMRTFIEENIMRGRQEGIYRSDLNAREMSKSYYQTFTILLSRGLHAKGEHPIKFLNDLFTHRLLSERGLNQVEDVNVM